MSIYISNDLYLQTLASQSAFNRPLIGWHSVVRPQDISVSGTGTSGAGGENVEAMWSPDTYTFWRSSLFHSSGGTNVYITLANPQALAVDYIGIAGHNFVDGGSGPLSFQMQHSFNGTTWIATNSALAITSNPSAIIMHFNLLQAPLHRLRVYIPGMSSGQNAQVQIAHIRMGRMLRLQRKMYVGVTPFTMDKRVEKIVSVSDSGKYLGTRVKSIHNLYTINQENNDPAWVRANVVPFLDHAELIKSDSYGPAGTFFAAWRPESYPNEVLYCHPPSSITRPNNQRPNGMMRWAIGGEAEA